MESPPTFICGKRWKNRRKPVETKILSSGVVFTFEEGISTPHVSHKGRQPLIECANMTLIFTVPFMSLYPLYLFYIFSLFVVDKGVSLCSYVFLNL